MRLANALGNGPLRGPLRGPAVWRGDQISDPQHWSLELDKVLLSKMRTVLRNAAAAGEQSKTTSFRWPASLVNKINRQLYRGRGLIVLKGFPVAARQEGKATELYWQLGLRIGTPLAQSYAGERIYPIRDEAYEGTADKPVLTSKTSVALPFHTDNIAGTDVLSMLTVRAAKRGGTSEFVSAHAIYNWMLEHHPRELKRLFQPFYFDRSLLPGDSQRKLVRIPVFAWSRDGLTVCYNRQRFARGLALANVPPKDIDRAALECFDDCLSAPDLALSFDLEAGDALFANNRTVLHRRTAFVDYSNARRGRLMLRLLLTRHAA
jgi:alpha-ketoglutarate-dependent taurine dioxygenase